MTQRKMRKSNEKRRAVWMVLLAMIAVAPWITAAAQDRPVDMKKELSKYKGKYKILFETYRDNNWDIFMMDPDGSNQQNVTKTPNVHEMYPQISPDGAKICFTVDAGKGRDTIRTVYYMNLDGTGRTKVVDYGREPNWTPDGHIAYCNQITKETFKVIDYFTKGLFIYDLKTCESAPIPSNDKIEHLYNQSFAPNGKWIASTVHAGMGVKHGNLLIEAKGKKILLTDAKGCRPAFSPDGKRLAWGRSDQVMHVAEIDLDSDEPKLKNIRECVKVEKPEKIYHIDWSPDGKFFTVSRGPDGHGTSGLPGTHFGNANEIIGVHAKDWDIWAVPARLDGPPVNLSGPEGKTHALNLTRNGLSNKESEWIVVRQ